MAGWETCEVFQVQLLGAPVRHRLLAILEGAGLALVVTFVLAWAGHLVAYLNEHRG